MEKELLFPTREMFEGATLGDCIRQSIITVRFEETDESEALSVFSAGLGIVGAPELAAGDQENLNILLTEIYKCYEKSGEVFCEFVRNTKRRVCNIPLALLAVQMESIAQSKYHHGLDVSRALCEEVAKHFFSEKASKASVDDLVCLLMVLPEVNINESEAKCLVDLCVRYERGFSEGVFDLTRYLLKLKMGHLMPKDISFPVEFSSRTADDDFTLTLQSLSDRQFLENTNSIMDIAMRENFQSTAKYRAFLTRCKETGAKPKSSKLGDLFTVLWPDDIDAELWEYLKQFSFVLPKCYVFKNKNWDIPDDLILRTETQNLPCERKLELIERGIKTEDDCVMFLRVNNDDQVLRIKAPWTKIFAKCPPQAFDDLVAKFNNFVDRRDRQAMLMDILMENDMSPRCCEICNKMRVVFPETAAKMLILKCQHFSPAFWNRIPYPKALIRLLSDPELEDKKYRIGQGILFLLYQAGWPLRGIDLPAVCRRGRVLDQTPESLREVLGICQSWQESQRQDPFFVGAEMSIQTQSLVVIAAVFIQMAMASMNVISEQLTIGGVENYLPILAFMCHQLIQAEYSERDCLKGTFLDKPEFLQYIAQHLDDQVHVGDFLDHIFHLFTGSVGFLTHHEIGFQLLNVVLADRSVRSPAYLGSTFKLISEITKRTRMEELHEYCQEKATEILAFIGHYADHILRNCDFREEDKIHLNAFPEEAVAQFITENASIDISFIAFVTNVCCDIPQFSIPESQKGMVAAVVQSLPDGPENEQLVMAVFSFLKHLGWSDVMASIIRLPITESVRVLAREYMRCGYDCPADAEESFRLLMEFADCKYGRADFHSKVETMIMDQDTLITYYRLRLERMSDAFELTIKTLFDQANSWFLRDPLEFCTATMELYDIPPTADFMLLRRAKAYPVRPATQANKELVVRLLSEARKNPSGNVYRCLKSIANVAPFIFPEISSEMSISDIFEMVMAQFANLNESILTDQNL